VKIGTLVTAVLGNVRANFGFSTTFCCCWVSSA